MKKISVIVPCYNTEKYIGQCIESILAQTHDNIEIICVDDGSTDATRDIIVEFQQKDNRIQLLCQKNMYAGVARNTGIDHATGEYICFLDSDDFFEKTMLEQLYSSAEINSSDIVLCNASLYDNSTGADTAASWVLHSEYLPSAKEVFSRNDIPALILRVSCSAPWNKLYRTQFIRDKLIKFMDTKRCNDVYFSDMCMLLAERISCVNRNLVHYRINNPDSLQGYSDDDGLYDAFKAAVKVRNEAHQRMLGEDIYKACNDEIVAASFSALSQQKNMAHFEKLYNFIRNEGFEDTGIVQMTKKDFWLNYEKSRFILEHSPIEFFYEQTQQLRTRIKRLRKYLPPKESLKGCKRLAIYGAGEIGRMYYGCLSWDANFEITGWYDKSFERLSSKGIPVKNPDFISKDEFDKIIIAIADEKISAAVKAYLINDLSVPEEYIVMAGDM